MSPGGRARTVAAIEQEAEALATYQLDLLAELERQIRAVHHTMRHIERLRSAKHRVGPELSNGQRVDTLASLQDEVAALDAQIATQRACCDDMLTVITKMQRHAAALRERAASAGQTTSTPHEEESSS